MCLMDVVPVDGTKGETMKKLIATVILFGLGTGLALAEENNLAVHKSMLQVQSGNYAASINHSGQESFRWR